MVNWITKIWKNKWHIIQGVWNSIFRTKYIEKIAADRMEICMHCPDLDLEGKKCMMPGTAPCCGKCGCSLEYKTRDLTSGCGNLDAPRWHSVETEKES